MKTNLKQQLNTYYENGSILESDGTVDTGCFNFYDWFCSDTSLENRSKKLFAALKTFLGKVDVDTENTYVFFKNNCPINGGTYDDFRICDIETGNVIWNVIPKRTLPSRSKVKEYKSEIWSSKNEFQKPIVEGPNFRKVLKNFEKKLEVN